MESLFAVKYCYLIPLLPLVGAMVAGFFGARWLKQQSHWPIWLGVGASAVLSFMLLKGTIEKIPQEAAAEPAEKMGMISSGAPPTEVFTTRTLYTWIDTGNPASPSSGFRANVGFFFDPLTAVMLCVVTGIGFLITVFSKGYMAGEAGYFRFFAYLGLFIFSMTILVMGDNFIMLYLGWEGVGLCSYLLIGYYYEKPSAREAAKKAFLVNRIGDFGFGLGIMLIYVTFGTVSYFSPDHRGALEQAAGISKEYWAMQWIPFLLMLGAFGKSAQFPLYVWLPDAMEGPTPVSALIHAATMVTAGVYMIVRCGTLFVGNAAAMTTIAVIGTFTALFAATIALRQFDLKKVFAYSTISQLGYMFAGAGLLAPTAAIFHLVTHAFFKALLFLSSGVVMHAMMGELDMRKMSGLKRVLPWTHAFMLVGCLALAGFPLFSGFFSKDEIVAAAWVQNKWLAVALLLGALLTAYYTFRLYFRVFQGPLVMPEAPSQHGADAHQSGHDAEEHHHNHEPLVMMLPLALLALGAVFAGYLNVPERSSSLERFLGHSPSLSLAHTVAVVAYPPGMVLPRPFGEEEVGDRAVQEEAHALHLRVMTISGAIAVLGIYLAYMLHRKYRQLGEELPQRFPLANRVLENRYWVDEIYQGFIVEPLRMLGRAFYAIDRIVVDGIVAVFGFVPQVAGMMLKLTTQRGSLQGYALLMLLGVVVILLMVLL